MKNILYITNLIDKKPLVDNIEHVEKKYNPFYLVLNNCEILLFKYENNDYKLIHSFSYLKEIPNITLLNHFYEKIFFELNIDLVFFRYENTEVIFIKNAQNILPIRYAYCNDIPIIYGKTSIDLINHNTPKNNNSLEKLKGVIYTGIFGDYEELIDPKDYNPNLDYICFTDNPNLESKIWKIRVLNNLSLDDTRKARTVKIMPHKFLKEYDYSIWVDAGFKIIDDLKEFIKEYSTNKSLLTIIHPDRDCIYDEAEICINSNKDDENIINKQIHKYKLVNYPKNNGLIASGVIFRKHNEKKVIKIMEEWYGQVINYSKRDQLSFNYICWKNNFSFDVANIFLWKNQYFEHFFHQQNEGYTLKNRYIHIIVIDYYKKNLQKTIENIRDINDDINITIISRNKLQKEFENIEYLYCNKLFELQEHISKILETSKSEYIYMINSGDLIHYKQLVYFIDCKNKFNKFDALILKNLNNPNNIRKKNLIPYQIIFNKKFLKSNILSEKDFSIDFFTEILIKTYQDNNLIINKEDLNIQEIIKEQEKSKQHSLIMKLSHLINKIHR